MPVNKYALLRYRIIDRCLSKKDYPNKEDLRQACEDSLFGSFGENISESTIEKDLWAMRNESELGYYAPIKYSKAEKGYYYENEDYSINDLSLNESDLESIQIAAQTLEQFRDNPIFKQYGNAIDKIVNRLKVSPNPEEKDISSLIQFESTPTAEGQHHLTTLFRAIKDQMIINITYLKYSNSEIGDYILEPYLLKEYASRWYLIAKDREVDKIKTFGLERIKNVDVTDSYFTPDSNFDPDKFFKYSIGITELHSEPETVELAFNRLQANYIKSSPIHKSQKLIKETESESVFQFEVLITYELIQLILGYGSGVRVLKPTKLVDAIKSELKKSLKAY